MKKRAVVAGAGLSGLTAATFLAKNGHQVVVLEKKRELGGRAATEVHGGASVNLGLHALYRAGAAAKIFRELGLEVSGGIPPVSGNLALSDRGLHALPGGPISLLTTDLLTPRGKIQAAKLLYAVRRADPATIPWEMSLSKWLSTKLDDLTALGLAGALFRVSTYNAAFDRASARASVEQLQRALIANVTYVHGGWGTFVEKLRREAAAAGATFYSGARAIAVDHGESVFAVRSADGHCFEADAVVLAVPPDDAAELAPRSEIGSWAVTPLRAATLDLVLSSLPQPNRGFALGVDRPLYFSVHSRSANVAPEGSAVINVARYGPDLEDGDEQELEDLVDRMQPGWRDRVVWRRFLPRITVTHAMVEAGRARPGPVVPSVRGLYVAGDWVGEEGMLADAAVASGKKAAQLIEGMTHEDAARTDCGTYLSVA